MHAMYSMTPVVLGHRGRAARRRAARRGVASVLAMMFLVLFGSLAAAMAVVAQGNLRTADSAVKVSRATSAAETGIVFAARRLEQVCQRFVVDKGVIDTDYAESLWLGTLGADELTVLDTADYEEDELPGGLMQAMFYLHETVDQHAIDVTPADTLLPTMDEETGVLLCKPIPVIDSVEGRAYFRLRYELVAGEPFVRVTSEGVDDDVSRRISLDFRITKRIEFAAISPNRIMIGKNVMVEGPLGSRYGLVDGELDTPNGDPLTVRSDFYYLDDGLSATIDLLYQVIRDSDVDGDNRMRPAHPTEGPAVAAEDGLIDYDGDEYVTDFDLFLMEYDGNEDQMVCYDVDLAAAAGIDDVEVEFTAIDDQLARLIDEARPDRDGDGDEGTVKDIALGYRDGVLDVNDGYAKVAGRLAFAVTEDAWESANGAPWQEVVQGPIAPDLDDVPVMFETPDEELLEITTDMFDGSQTWLESQVSADATDFADQVDAGVADGGVSTPPSDESWESVPYGASGAYDWYQRHIYDGITFTNVRIPKGTNALFVRCTFIGVTWIESEEDCTDPNWNYAGALERIDNGDGTYSYDLKFDLTAMLDGVEVADTRTISNNIRFHDCTFLGSIGGDRILEYTHWRNKIQMTGNTRFYLDVEDSELLAQDDAEALVEMLETIDEEDVVELGKSSMLMPGWSIDVGNFNNEQADDPEDTPMVRLRGTIIAGVLDVRGTADVFGSLIMTYRPTAGAGPLFYGGQTDAFNTTIGYFGPADGDSEGAGPDDAGFAGFGYIRLRYNSNALLPDGIPWPVSMESVEGTYVEGGV